MDQLSIGDHHSLQTAAVYDTIWHRISEDTFRQHLVALEKRTNAVPMGPRVFKLEDTAETDRKDARRLPLSVEQQVADDFAFVAAVQQGAQSVAATCIEQRHSQPSMTIRFAAADTIEESVQHMLSQICAILTRGEGGDVCGQSRRADEILALVVRCHRGKLLGRLRSNKWVKPRYLAATHKKPLWQDFANVVHRVQHIYPSRKEKDKRVTVEQRLKTLCVCYEQFEQVADQMIDNTLEQLVKQTFEFCKNNAIQEFAAKLEEVRPTAQIAAALKCLHQLEKVGAYWRIAIDLVGAASKYPKCFESIVLQYLKPYASIPTSIAYEPWAKTCHVHAEIQLVVDYDLRHTQRVAIEADVLRPRTIGTSKYLCYLCHLFIKFHGGFPLTNTHGRLYDQWTVPDLVEYNQTLRDRYAAVLFQMNAVIRDHLGDGPCWRAEPMTSRQNLLDDVPP